jgi:hypothetical protein
MVGDMPSRDVEGAKKLGMKTCFARYGNIKVKRSKADYDIEDIKVYMDLLKQSNIHSSVFDRVKYWGEMRLAKRQVATKARIKVYGAKFVKEGAIISFSLDKGQYATTFLAHLFKVISGMPPSWISDTEFDLKQEIGEEGISETLKYFNGVLASKRDSKIFSKIV